MKQHLIIILLHFLFLYTHSFASKSDSLVRVNYLEIRKTIEKNPSVAKSQIEIFQRKDSNLLRKALANCLWGMYYFQKDVSQAEKYFKEAKKIFKDLNDQKGMLTSQMGLANISFMKQRYDEALKKYLEVLKQLDSTNSADRYNITNIHNNIASLYRIQNNFDKSIIYYKKALKGYELAKDTNGIALVTFKLGSNLFDQYQFEEAKNYFLKALNLANLTEDFINQSRILTKIGDIHFIRNDFTSALTYYQNSVKAASLGGATCSQLDGLNGQASALNKLKRFSDVEIITQSAILLCKECSMDLMLQDFYKELAIAQFGQNKFDLALKNLAISDSLTYNQTVEDIRAESEELEVKYRTAEKDNELLVKKLELASQDQKITKQKQIIWLIVGISIVVVISLISFVVLWKKQKKINAEIKRLSDFDNLLYSIIGHDLRHAIYSVNYLDSKEDIQQSTNNTLLVLDGLLEWRKKSDSEKSIVSFEKIIDELQDEFEIDINRNNIKIETNFTDLPELFGSESALKTILRNALSNAIKYSPANSTIRIAGDDSFVQLINQVDKGKSSGTKIGHTIIEALSYKHQLDFSFRLEDNYAESTLKVRA